MRPSESQESQDRIRSGLPELETTVELTAAGFSKPISEELRRDVAQHLVGTRTRTIEHDRETVGYAVFDDFNFIIGENEQTSLIYLRGIIIAPEYQGRHIAGRVIDDVTSGKPFDFFGLRTQSSIMYAAVERRFEEVYPALRNEPVPRDVRVVGQSLATAIDSTFPLHEGAYGGPLYGIEPQHHDAEYQADFDKVCPDFERGDAILCIARGLRNAE